MLYTRLAVPIFLTLSLSSSFSFAEEAITTLASSQIVSEEDYIGDVPKVLTISRLSQSIADSPSAVTVIERETIRAAGIVDLPEVFRLVPGFNVGTNARYVHSTNHAVSIMV